MKSKVAKIVSKKSISLNMNGLVITPIAFGPLGHRSRTSKMKGLRLNILAKMPGIPAVKGVDVAKRISYFLRRKWLLKGFALPKGFQNGYRSV